MDSAFIDIIVRVNAEQGLRSVSFGAEVERLPQIPEGALGESEVKSIMVGLRHFAAKERAPNETVSYGRDIGDRG
jgi:hypothetical protein